MRENEGRVRLLLIVVLIVGIVLSIQQQLFPGTRYERYSDIFHYYTYVYFLFIGFSLLFIALENLIRNRLLRIRQLFYAFVVGSHLSLFMLLTLVDLMHTDSLLAFVLPVILFPVMIRFSLPAVLLMLVYCYSFISVGILFFSPSLDTFQHLFLLVYLMVSLLIWWTQERLWKSNFLTRVMLEQEIQDKEAAEQRLRNVQYKLIENAHNAGMAQIASDTLHNIGNILNSLQTSIDLLKKSLRFDLAEQFSKTCDLLKDHQQNLSQFLAADPKGIKLLDYMFILEKEFREAFEEINRVVGRLDEKSSSISKVVLSQQRFVSDASIVEPIEVTSVIEEALLLTPELKNQTIIKIDRHYEPIPLVVLSRVKLLHCFVNLFSNAAHALINHSNDAKHLILSVNLKDKYIQIQVSDNGYGIAPSNRKKIFGQGFSTKPEGSGFGLHSCALYLQQMNIQIQVDSPGVGKGTTFTLLIPDQAYQQTEIEAQHQDHH